MPSENQSWPSGASLAGGRGPGAPTLPAWRRPPVLLWLVVFCLAGDVLTLAGRAYSDFRNYRDITNPDSAVTLRIAEYVQTGKLYPDINQPPYYPTLYGPLGYVILSVPYRLAARYSYPPERALRLAVFAFFLASLALVFLLARRWTGSKNLGLLAALFAASGTGLHGQAMLIRFDWLGVSFALLGLRLCLGSERRGQLALAAICGGAALLCKQTFVAMPAAVVLWLFWQRRFLHALVWATGIAFITVCGYEYFIGREPLAWQHWAALSRPVYEFHYGGQIVMRAMREAKVLFFLIGAYFAWRHRREQAGLILLYGLAAALVALVTITQVGGAINYFLEFWAVASIVAALGLVELDRQLSRAPLAVSMAFIVLLSLFFARKLTIDGREALATYQETRDYSQRREQWERFRSALAGERLLAFEPSITLWSSVPEVPDPLLNTLMERSGTWSSAPIVRNIGRGVYDAIVDNDDEMDYRGVKPFLPAVRAAIPRYYLRACDFEGYSVWLPVHRPPDLYGRLVRAGCAPIE